MASNKDYEDGLKHGRESGLLMAHKILMDAAFAYFAEDNEKMSSVLKGFAKDMKIKAKEARDGK